MLTCPSFLEMNYDSSKQSHGSKISALLDLVEILLAKTGRTHKRQELSVSQSGIRCLLSCRAWFCSGLLEFFDDHHLLLICRMEFQTKLQ